MPFGQPTEPTPPSDLRQFQPPPRPSRTTLWLVISIVAAIVAIVLVLQFTGGFSSSEPSPSATVSAQPSPETSLSPAIVGGAAIPFEGNGTGLFEILSQEWGPEGLTIEYRISLDEGQGERSFSLYMFNNATLEVADPLDYELVTVGAGEQYTGTVSFAVERGRGTLVLSTFSTPLAALDITG